MTDKTGILEQEVLTNEQQFAITLRCLEYLADNQSPERLVESVRDFRGSLEEDALAFVDSEEINEACEDLFSGVSAEKQIMDMIQSLFDQAGSSGDFLVGFLEGR